MKFSLKTAAYSALTAGLLLAAAPAARAQDAPVMFEGLAGQLAINNMLFENTVGRSLRENATNSKPAAPKTTVAALTYTSTPALRQKAVASYATQLARTNPTAAQGVREGFGPGKTDYGQVYANIVRGTGLRENSAADALAGFLALGTLIANNGQDRAAITPAMAGSVRRQAQVVLTQTPTLSAPGAAAEFGEALKLQTVMLEAGWLGASQNNTLPAYQQTIAAFLKKQYGFDVSQLTVTDQGLTKK
ncbi:hypothetical protein [Hymenobacter ruricola]|uniref:DUF4919 domain-containing protein n=1 Tax=Hymenobacter ruricola TaxID=2791023 RepID=A0ABS0I579_9BACT|nr:hypothetical protein [Hymenobacter ruricola]MBF9221931.1 hypothetical protein [Hymenobacter ruricola]